MTVADRIRDKRNELGISQSELARRIGTKDRSTISQIENSGDNITMKNIIRIAEALNVTPHYLMGWGDGKKESPNSNDESIKTMVEWGKKFSDYSPEQINKALGIATLYEKSSPEVQAAIETLLKSVRQET